MNFKCQTFNILLYWEMLKLNFISGNNLIWEVTELNGKGKEDIEPKTKEKGK